MQICSHNCARRIAGHDGLVSKVKGILKKVSYKVMLAKSNIVDWKTGSRVTVTNVTIASDNGDQNMVHELKSNYDVVPCCMAVSSRNSSMYSI